MGITPEEYLLFLQNGLESGVLHDLLVAEAHIDRMRDLLHVGVAVVAAEMDTAMDSDLAIDSKRFEELSELQEILCRQSSVLTPVLASVQATHSMLLGDLEVKGADIYARMVELIANHPQLLEDQAAANAVASNDKDASTQGKRFQLKRLLRSND